MQVKSYKDFDGNKVKIGDSIANLNYDGSILKEMGTVIAIRKEGFYVHPETTLTSRKDQLWGKFTKKVN